MILLDTNLLIYAHRSAASEHEAAQQAIEKACVSPGGCGIATFTVSEFWAVVTHPGSAAPSSEDDASAFLDMLVADGGVAVLHPADGFASRLMKVAASQGVVGTRIFDLQIALLGLEHGAREVWTYDRAFVKLPGLRRVRPGAS